MFGKSTDLSAHIQSVFTYLIHTCLHNNRLAFDKVFQFDKTRNYFLNCKRFDSNTKKRHGMIYDGRCHSCVKSVNRLRNTEACNRESRNNDLVD